MGKPIRFYQLVPPMPAMESWGDLMQQLPWLIFLWKLF